MRWAKTSMLKLGEYEKWEIKSSSTFQIQDSALWEVKRTVAANNDDKNLAFLTTSSPSIHEDLEQLHDDDLKEMDLKWNMALLSMRARKFYQRTGRKIIIDRSSTAGYDISKRSSSKAVRIEDASEKAMCAIDGAGFDWSDMAEDEIQANMASLHSQIFSENLAYTVLNNSKQPEVNEYGPRDSSLKPATICDRESDNSKENTDDSLTQQPKTVTETSSVMSPLKVDKDWKEKFFHPANHVRVEEPKKARNNTDAPIIEDWVSDDEEESNSQLNDKGFMDSGCSRHMSGNIAYLSDFKEFDGGYVTFGGGANRGRITCKGIQGVSESSTSSQQDQDCIVMLIWKDASYFNDTSLKSIVDAQIQDQDGTHDDCSLQDNGTDDQQVNTASPEVTTGSREISTAVPEVNTATPEDLMGPILTTKYTQVEDQEIELGNISPSYAVSSTPHTRI
ncbi:hypothetical protein Tco_1299499, partial [Tanacetum coccineum]